MESVLVEFSTILSSGVSASAIATHKRRSCLSLDINRTARQLGLERDEIVSRFRKLDTYIEHNLQQKHITK